MPHEEKQEVHLRTTTDQVESLKIGDKVAVRIEGTVIGLRAEDEFTYHSSGGEEVPERFPPHIDVEVDKLRVVAEDNEFIRMAKDEMGEV